MDVAYLWHKDRFHFSRTKWWLFYSYPNFIFNPDVFVKNYAPGRKTNKYTWAPLTVHNTPVMTILKGYFYIILF